MKIQVLGHRGTLGQAVVEYASQDHEVVTPEIDITHVESFDIKAPIVINCAGLVKQRMDSSYNFMHVNGAAPHRLAEACDKAGSRMIHVSTDCVFGKSGPSSENSRPSFTLGDIYATSKFAGEVINEPHLTIRTSFIGFGKYGLITDLLNDQPVLASRNLLWTGHTSDTIAEVLVLLAGRPDVTGLLHVPGEEQTRYRVAHMVSQWLEKGSVVENAYQADRRLVSRRWAGFFLPDLPSFEKQLEKMKRREVS